MFIQHPHSHGLDGCGAHHCRQTRGQFSLERGRLGRVFFGVRFARHLQLASNSAQQLAHRALGQIFAGAFFDPRLRIPRLPELARLQPRDQLFSHGPAHRRHRPAAVAALQQPRHPVADDLVSIGKHGLPTHVGHPHNLRHRQLMLRDQPHHQQALPRPLFLRPRPCRFDLRHHRQAQFR